MSQKMLPALLRQKSIFFSHAPGSTIYSSIAEEKPELSQGLGRVSCEQICLFGCSLASGPLPECANSQHNNGELFKFRLHLESTLSLCDATATDRQTSLQKVSTFRTEFMIL